MTVEYEAMLREFHEKYYHFIGAAHKVPYDVWELRIKLIQEEVNEELIPVMRKLQTGVVIDMEDLILFADALADTLYVVFGAALATGIPIGEVFTEIHRSNMTKSMLKDEKSIKGKTIKGPDYDPPKLQEIIEQSLRNASLVSVSIRHPESAD